MYANNMIDNLPSSSQHGGPSSGLPIANLMLIWDLMRIEAHGDKPLVPKGPKGQDAHDPATDVTPAQLQDALSQAGVSLTAEDFLVQRKSPGRPVPNLPRRYVSAVVSVGRALDAFLDQVGLEYRDVTITSGYRPASYNAAVGGSESSDHIVAAAIDFRVASSIFPRAQAAMRQLWDERVVNGWGTYCGSKSFHLGVATPFTKGHRKWAAPSCPEEAS